MKKPISILLVIIFLCTSVLVPVYSNNNEEPSLTDKEVPTTVEEVINTANQDIEELFGKEFKNYYPIDRTSKGILNEDHIMNQLSKRANGGDMENNPLQFSIMYGDPHGRVVTHNAEAKIAYAGWSKSGQAMPTEGFPWDAGWSGNKIQDMDLIKYPWNDAAVRARFKKEHGLDERNPFNDYLNTESPYLKNSNGTFERAILNGLNRDYAGKPYRDFIYKNQQSHLQDVTVYDFDAKPSRYKGNWIDYVNIVEPPTFYTWGMGRIYIRRSNNTPSYLSIPIAPFSYNHKDISAHFETFRSGAVAEREVLLGVRVVSTFPEAETTDFTWEIRSTDGKALPYTLMGQGVTSSTSSIGEGANTEENDPQIITGEITLQPDTELLLYALFTMPESDVDVRFTVNKKGDRPLRERTYENNTAEGTVKRVENIPPVREKHDLDYHILSKEISFPLMNGALIQAKLELPDGWSWDGNATGALNVSSVLFEPFQVTNNPAVDEASETITRTPTISKTLQRTDFGDDPVGRKWLNLASPTLPVTLQREIEFGGKVSRPASHTYEICTTWEDEEGEKHKDCTTYTDRKLIEADFNEGPDTRILNTYVYNGRRQVPPKTYENKISNNTTESRKKDLLWSNEPYPFDVIRWMAHERVNGDLYNWTAVDGQYKRIFTQQASGGVTWGVEKSMSHEYSKSREAASRRDTRKSEYDKAVFATDRQLQGEDYPIKSGYYFNPTGTYTFTVQTVTYKEKSGGTTDHQDLVDSVINSFRYETDVMYINNAKQAVNLRGESLPKRGNSYDKKPAVLSVQNNKGVNGEPLVHVERAKQPVKSEEIQHSQARNQGENGTHLFWKNILEGYTQSGTQGSVTDFKYREYVKTTSPKQTMFRITEETKVTIQVNKENHFQYTHVHMPNGEYSVRAWVEDVNLRTSAHAYKAIRDPIRGIQTLDHIKVTVRGSMHDDINN